MQWQAELQPQRRRLAQYLIDGIIAKTYSLTSRQTLADLPKLPKEWSWYLSTPEIPDIQIGTAIKPTNKNLPIRKGFQLACRFIALPKGNIEANPKSVDEILELAKNQEPNPLDLEQLGIMEDDRLEDEERLPFVRGRGSKNEAIAVCEMIALYEQVPFRRDTIQVLDNQFRRDKGLNLELIADFELLCMSSQLAKTATTYIDSVEVLKVSSFRYIPCFLWH